MFGVGGGFDVVIGNPPYKQVSKNVFSSEQFPYSEGKDKGKQNLYKLFVEIAYNLAKCNGCNCLIVQSSLLGDISSSFTRELLLTKTAIKEIVEFPKTAPTNEGQVFGTVLQGTCIVLFSKESPGDNHRFLISINNDKNTMKSLVFESIVQLSLLDFYSESFCIPLIRTGEYALIKKISNESVKFMEIIKTLSQGDLNLTSSKSYVTTRKTKTKLLRGRNISKYVINYNSNEFILSGYKDDNIKLYKRNIYLVCQEVTGTVDKRRLHFALTDKNEKFLFGHTANKILLNDQKNNLILLGILNSKLLDWYFRKTSTNNHVGGYEINQFPIILSNIKINNELISIVDDIIARKATIPQTDTSALEQQVDALVYRLYGLTYEEVKVIEPEFPLGRAEYGGIGG
jgi:Alw26I/Eco31I/Esp3I family type II restriction m6 adenine DNA methyltransferase